MVISSNQIIHPAQAPTDVSQGFHGTAILKDGTVIVSNAITDGVYVLRPNTLQRKVGFMVGFNDDAGGDDGTAVNINLKDGDVYLSVEQEVFHTVSLPELRGQLLAEPGLRYSPKDYWSSLSEVQKADCKAVLNGNAKLAHLVNVLDLSGQWQSL